MLQVKCSVHNVMYFEVYSVYLLYVRIIVCAIPLPTTTTTAQTKFYATRCYSDVLTIKSCRSEDSTDDMTCGTWYAIWCWCCTWYPLAPLKAFIFWSFYRIDNVYRYRHRYLIYIEIVSVRYFLSYRYRTIIPKLSVRYPPQTSISSVISTPFQLPTLFLLSFRTCPCVASAPIASSTYKRVFLSYAFKRRKCYPSDSYIWPYRRGVGRPFLP